MKAVLFDFGQVLIDLDFKRWQRQMHALVDERYDLDDIQTYFQRWFESFESGQISEVLFINGLIKYADPGIQARDVIDAWNSMLIGIPQESFEVLDRLCLTHRCYLVSNTNSIHMRWVQQHLSTQHSDKEWSRYFEKQFLSFEMRD